MTEAEWLTCRDPQRMLNLLQGKVSERKLRLFLTACCCRTIRLLRKQSRKALRVMERYADGFATETQMRAARAATEINKYRVDNRASALARSAISYSCSLDFRHYYMVGWAVNSAALALGRAGAVSDDEADEGMLLELSVQSNLARDIFGNPFHPLPPRPEAIAPLAEQIYAGAWDKMPLLGEWLQEHSYWSEGEHCLDPKNHHVKGCWVVDWVTGRE